MPELADAEAVTMMAEDGRSAVQALRAVVGWVGIILQVMVQILRFNPSSWALSFVRLRDHPHSLLSSSIPFKPLPAENPGEIFVTAPISVTSSVPAATEEIEKLTIVLDLDETLVCAYEASILPEEIRTQAINAGLKCFELQCRTLDKEVEGGEKINHIVVFERPGLEEFLEQISKFADLVLFTAGLEGYASPLVDVIDVNNRFSLRLYRPATITTAYRQHVKDLSCLSKDLRRVILIDNNPFSFLLQPLNGIPCTPFSAGQPYDEQLLKVLLPLLKHLSLEEDVRPELYQRFYMPEWFARHGISIPIL